MEHLEHLHLVHLHLKEELDNLEDQVVVVGFVEILEDQVILLQDLQYHKVIMEDLDRQLHLKQLVVVVEQQVVVEMLEMQVVMVDQEQQIILMDHAQHMLVVAVEV